MDKITITFEKTDDTFWECTIADTEEKELLSNCSPVLKADMEKVITDIYIHIMYVSGKYRKELKKRK